VPSVYMLRYVNSQHIIFNDLFMMEGLVVTVIHEQYGNGTVF
jgi:hypothetical protein